MSHIIRSAGLDDVEQVASLWSTSAGPTALPGGRTEATRLLARDSESLLVAEAHLKIVGALIVGWDGWRCHLYRMAVEESSRRQGVASALFDEAIRRAKRQGATRVDAMVDQSNGAAIEFWQSVDFQLDTKDRRWSLLLDESSGEFTTQPQPQP